MKTNKKLTEEHMAVIREMFLNGSSYDQISDFMEKEYDLRINKDTIRWHAVRKYKHQQNVNDTKQPNEKTSSGECDVLILSDLHVPYQSDEVLNIVAKHSDAKVIVFNGDLVDCGEISKFCNLKTRSLIDEMMVAHEFLRAVDGAAPDAVKILVTGNHEERWMKYMSKVDDRISPLHSSNILQEIVNGFDYYDHKRNRHMSFSELDRYIVADKWYYQIGDLIVCHPTSFSKIECRTAANAADYFKKLKKDFSTVVVGHTHRQGEVLRNGILAVEQGCLCKQMDYTQKGNLSFSPWNVGYYLAHFDGNEKIIWNKSRLYKL